MKQLLTLKTIERVLLVWSILGLFASISLLAYKNKDAILQVLHNGTTVKPESYTELYFQNNENLPQKPKLIVNYDAVPYTFAFSIHNMEHKDVTYSYVVSMTGVKNEKLDSQDITVKNGQTKTITETFYLPNLVTTRTKITASLINKNQSIFFWMGGQE